MRVRPQVAQGKRLSGRSGVANYNNATFAFVSSLMLCNLFQPVTLAEVACLLFCVNVPDDIVGKALDRVASALGHLSEALGLGLVFERVSREVDTFNSVSDCSRSSAAEETYLICGHRP